MHSFRSLAEVILLVTFCSVINGFYVPGVAPRDYTKGEPVGIKVVLF